MPLRPVRTFRLGQAVVGVLEGEIDIANVEAASAQLIRSVPADAIGLVIDMSAVQYLDSSGVHMVFDLTRKLANSRQGLAVALPEEAPLRRLLKIANVSEAAPVTSTVEQAVEALELDQGGY